VADKIIASRIAGDLLVVFDVAMRERCMHRSAIRLGLTELDVRCALAQLDATLGEPVFSIEGSSLTPTSCAQRLAFDLRHGRGPDTQ
jgi:DNA-binding transcriptional LysR family regulator